MLERSYNEVFAPHVPGHVPQELVIDFDFHNDLRFGNDPHAGVKRLESECPPVFFTPRFGGHWVIARGILVERALHDTAHFSSASVTIPKAVKTPFQLVPIELDPPEHASYRRILIPPLSPQAVQTLAERLRSDAVRLIENVYTSGQCEFVADISYRFPIEAFLRLAGLPLSDRERLVSWANTVTHGQDVELRRQAIAAAREYLEGVIIERTRHPGLDIMSQIVQAEINSDPISHERLIGFLTTVLFGGLDTITQTMNFIQRFLAEHPKDRQLIADDPSLLPNAIEEMMRRYPVSITVGRVAACDFTFEGVSIKEGESIYVPLVLANMIDDECPDPLTVDFRRKRVINRGFSIGVHRCPGSYLARLELRIFFEEWLRRIPHYDLEPGFDVHVTAGTLCSIERLPLRWTPVPKC